LPLGFVIFHLQHFGESKDFYQTSTVSSKIYFLSKIKKYLNLESRQLFYTGYILPLIDYCCVVWGHCANEELNRILKLQKRTARLILDQASRML
jgi:hypothetical protein